MGTVPLRNPTGDLVAVAFIQSLQDFPDNAVATSLPSNQAGWAEKGFVTVSIVGGSPSVDLHQRRSVVSVDSWAVNANSTSAPWNKANDLAEIIFAATQADRIDSALRDIKLNYRQARILDAHPLTEPRRIEGDPSGFAHMTFDLQIDWTIEVSP